MEGEQDLVPAVDRGHAVRIVQNSALCQDVIVFVENSEIRGIFHLVGKARFGENDLHRVAAGPRVKQRHADAGLRRILGIQLEADVALDDRRKREIGVLVRELGAVIAGPPQSQKLARTVKRPVQRGNVAITADNVPVRRPDAVSRPAAIPYRRRIQKNGNGITFEILGHGCLPEGRNRPHHEEA